MTLISSRVVSACRDSSLMRLGVYPTVGEMWGQFINPSSHASCAVNAALLCPGDDTKTIMDTLLWQVTWG